MLPLGLKFLSFSFLLQLLHLLLLQKTVICRLGFGKQYIFIWPCNTIVSNLFVCVQYIEDSIHSEVPRGTLTLYFILQSLSSYLGIVFLFKPVNKCTGGRERGGAGGGGKLVSRKCLL
jgi:hypothetical protein